LINGGETHNFIDSALVAKRSIPTIDFEGFDVVVASGRNMPCTHNNPQLCVALGNYTIIDDFYVVELLDIDIILGVQWLVSLGKHYVDYQATELEFMTIYDKKVVLRGMSNDAPRIVSAK
jgi:hypothetical protein